MFRFNFTADDLELDDPALNEDQDNQGNAAADELSKPLEALSVSGQPDTEAPSDKSAPSTITADSGLVPASKLDLLSKTCLQSLPRLVHYELAQIPVLTQGAGSGTAIAKDLSTGREKEVVTIYKRNLEDVKFQMAQEDDGLDAAEDTNKTAPGSTGNQSVKAGPGGQEILALAGKSDLVKGVYEGGLKTWECAIDLVAYLADQKENYDDKKVLELGCGSALPGVYILTKSNTVQVDLQDYNDSVLKLVTLPNVLLNTHLRPDQHPAEEEEDDDDEKETEADKTKDKDGETGDDDDEEDDEDEMEPEGNSDEDFEGSELDFPASDEDRTKLLQKVSAQSRFIMGDWGGLVKLMDFQSDADKYDLILTSETIYAEESHQKLYDTIKNSLKRDGKALVAAKTFYFGVGGDILSFRRLIEKDGVFNIKVVFSAQAFVRREILELTFKA